MKFVKERNFALTPPRQINPRFSSIAYYYKTIGECIVRVNEKCVGIRWDYAFFQMLVETNYLLFTGGVRPNDNNFAGVGATIAGKPGERFRTIKEGVRAHLEHVLMYSGHTFDYTIAKRTMEVQEKVHAKLSALGHPVTFADLATIWTGTDQNTYGASLERTYQRYSKRFCAQ